MARAENGTWLSVGAAAAKLGCSPEEIHQRVAAGKLSAVQAIGKTWIDIKETPARPVSHHSRQQSSRPSVVPWSLAICITVACVAAAVWSLARLDSLQARIDSDQRHTEIVQSTLQIARQDLDQARKELDESRTQIQRLNALLDAAGKDLAQRDAVAQTALARLRTHNEQLNARIAQLEAQLTAAPEPVADATASNSPPAVDQASPAEPPLR